MIEITEVSVKLNRADRVVFRAYELLVSLLLRPRSSIVLRFLFLGRDVFTRDQRFYSQTSRIKIRNKRLDLLFFFFLYFLFLLFLLFLFCAAIKAYP